jgi:hypothetical protein
MGGGISAWGVSGSASGVLSGGTAGRMTAMAERFPASGRGFPETSKRPWIKAERHNARTRGLAFLILIGQAYGFNSRDSDNIQDFKNTAVRWSV